MEQKYSYRLGVVLLCVLLILSINASFSLATNSTNETNTTIHFNETNTTTIHDETRATLIELELQPQQTFQSTNETNSTVVNKTTTIKLPTKTKKEIPKVKTTTTYLVQLREEQPQNSRSINTRSQSTTRTKTFAEVAPEAKIKRRLQSIPFAEIEASEEELNELIRQGVVQSVQPNERVHAFLSTVNPFIGVDTLQAHNFDSNTLNGTGTTVCIIDTGINASHSDFASGTVLATQCYVDDLNLSDTTGWCANGNRTDTNVSDDHGHGTHVASIITSHDATYQGVAPGAKLVIVKALASDGSGWNSDVIAGIDWCVTNKDTYNISVISMSLGGGGYTSTSTCESANVAYTASVDAAVAANITVFAASGNCYQTGGGCSTAYVNKIAVPACIASAISVGATDESDDMAYFSQRGDLLDIVAPGYPITAANYLGGHIAKSGTSMSAPYVAGFAANIIQSWQIIYGRNPTPTELKTALLANSITIEDNATNNYSRITPFPQATSVSPENNTNQLNNSVEFTFQTTRYTTFFTLNASAETNLSCAIYINNTINATESTLANGSTQTITVANLTTGDYSWYTNCTDASNNSAITTTNYFSIDSDRPNITLVTPTNNSWTASNSISLGYTVNDSMGVDWCATYLSGSLLENATSLNTDGNVTNYANTTVTNGNYSWYVSCADGFGSQLTTTDTYYFRADTQDPVTTLTGVVAGTQTQDNITFTLSTTNYGPSAANRTEYILNNVTYNYSTPVNITTEGNYNLSYYGIDNAGNIENTKSISFSIDRTAPSLTWTQPTNNSITKETLAVLFNTSELTTTTLALNETIIALYNSTDSVNTSESIITFAEGMYQLSITSTDNANNSITSTKNITLDKTAPLATFTTTSQYTSTDVNITGTLSETTSSIASVEVYNGTNWTSATENNTNFWYYFTPSQDSTSTIQVRATDTAGNTQSIIDEISITYDTTAPTTTITSLQSTARGNTNITLITEANDAVSVTNVTATINGSNYTLTNTQGSIYQTTITTPSTEGNYTVFVTAVDQTNNNITINTSILINNTIPIIYLSKDNLSFIANQTSVTIITTNASNSQYNTSANSTLISFADTTNVTVQGSYGNFAIYIVANNSVANVSTLYNYTIYDSTLTINETALAEYTTNNYVTVQGNIINTTAITAFTINGATKTLSGTNFTENITLSEGNNTITISVTDSGDQTTTTILSIYKDTITPYATFTSNGTLSNGWYTAHALTFAVNDSSTSSGSSAQYWSGSAWTNVTVLNLTTSQEVIYRSIDNAGNTQSNQTTGTISIDTTAPAITTTLSKQAYNENETITMQATVIDTLSGLDTVQATLNGNTYALIKSGNTYATTTTIATAGTYVLTITAIDYAGNTQTATESIVISQDLEEEIGLTYLNTTTTTHNYSSSLNATLAIAVNTTVIGNLTSTIVDNTSYFNNTVGNATTYYSFEATDSVDDVIKSIYVKLYYDPTEYLGFNESSFQMYWYNETSGTWLGLTNTVSFVIATGVNTADNYVWANVTHFSSYTYTAEGIMCTSVLNSNNLTTANCYHEGTYHASGSGYICDGTFDTDACSTTESSAAASSGTTGNTTTTDDLLAEEVTASDIVIAQKDTNESRLTKTGEEVKTTTIPSRDAEGNTTTKKTNTESPLKKKVRKPIPISSWIWIGGLVIIVAAIAGRLFVLRRRRIEEEEYWAYRDELKRKRAARKRKAAKQEAAKKSANKSTKKATSRKKVARKTAAKKKTAKKSSQKNTRKTPTTKRTVNKKTSSRTVKKRR